MSDVARRASAVAATFEQHLGHRPEGTWAAPGRINLIGEHTDYNAGFVLPFAIDREAVMAVGRRPDDVVRAWSAQRGEVALSVDAIGEQPQVGWIGYIAGVVWALREVGVPMVGLDVVLDSDVPIGAGWSSSAALECAVAVAVTDLAGVDVGRMSLAVAAQRAESEIVQAPVGVMDQAVSLLARAGTALFLDCRSLGFERVPLRLDRTGLALLVVDTHVEHAHATGSYAARRAECEQAAHALGVTALRDADAAQLEQLSGVLAQRARHVVAENARVLAAVELLRAGRLCDIGDLLLASHASLRDDFEVSVPELDLAVEASVSAGALGARMTGGGFGGSVLAVVPEAAADDVRRAVATAFGSRGFRTPTVTMVTTADGARRVEPV